MPRRTQSEHRTRQTANETWDDVIGFVTKVFQHDDSESFLSNHEVNVQLAGRAEEFKRIPIHTDHNGSIYVPQVGDAVQLSFLQSRTQRPVVTNIVYTDQNRAPLARSGHFRRKFGSDDADTNLYLEAEPTDHSAGDAETLRMAVKADGVSNPIARIELDQSGSEPVIRLTRGSEADGNTDMGLELDFDSGGIKLGDGSGYGIVSDGNGNFTWYEQSVDFVDDGSTIDW